MIIYFSLNELIPAVAANAFIEATRMPYAKIIESPHPCPTGTQFVEINIPECPLEVFSLKFHESSNMVVDREQDEKDAERSWVEVFILKPTVRNITYENIKDEYLERVGNRYYDNELPGLENMPDLLVPAKRFFIKYFVPPPAGRASAARGKGYRKLNPSGFKAVAFPCGDMPQGWVVGFAHGSKLLQNIAGKIPSPSIQFAMQHIEELLSVAATSDNPTREYCAGIITNLASSAFSFYLLKRDYREQLLEVKISALRFNK